MGEMKEILVEVLSMKKRAGGREKRRDNSFVLVAEGERKKESVFELK